MRGHENNRSWLGCARYTVIRLPRARRPGNARLGFQRSFPSARTAPRRRRRRHRVRSRRGQARQDRRRRGNRARVTTGSVAPCRRKYPVVAAPRLRLGRALWPAPTGWHGGADIHRAARHAGIVKPAGPHTCGTRPSPGFPCRTRRKPPATDGRQLPGSAPLSVDNRAGTCVGRHVATSSPPKGTYLRGMFRLADSAGQADA